MLLSYIHSLYYIPILYCYLLYDTTHTHSFYPSTHSITLLFMHLFVTICLFYTPYYFLGPPHSITGIPLYCCCIMRIIYYAVKYRNWAVYSWLMLVLVYHFISIGMLSIHYSLLNIYSSSYFIDHHTIYYHTFIRNIGPFSYPYARTNSVRIYGLSTFLYTCYSMHKMTQLLCIIKNSQADRICLSIGTLTLCCMTILSESPTGGIH